MRTYRFSAAVAAGTAPSALGSSNTGTTTLGCPSTPTSSINNKTQEPTIRIATRSQAAAAAASSSSTPQIFLMKQSTISPSAHMAHIKSAPFPWVLNSFIERGATVNASQVVNHPEAPHPLEVLRELLFHVAPGRSVMIELLKKATEMELKFSRSEEGIAAKKASNRVHLLTDGSTPATIPHVATLLPSVNYSATMNPQLFVDVVEANPLLTEDTDVLQHLVTYLLGQQLWEKAALTFLRIPASMTKVHSWHAVLRPLRKGFLRDYELLGKLMSPQTYPKNQFVLSVEAASELLSNAGLVGQFSPIVAASILDRYLAFVSQQEVALKQRAKREDRASVKVAVHPTPFLIFFGIVAAQKHPTRKWCYLHWQVCWSYFQVLNTKCPTWYETSAKPEEAEHLCKFLLSTIANGANPWLTLNVARSMAKRHIVDGVDIAIWMLHRLSPMHYPDEARGIAKKLFTWLIDVVGIHAHSKYERQVVPAARVLINLGMHSSLSQLHSLVFDHLFDMSNNFRDQFTEVFEDLVCPMCNTMLDSENVHVERSCNNCLYMVPAKERNLLPSFSRDAKKKTEKQVDKAKQRAKERGKSALGVMHGSMRTLSVSTAEQRKQQQREQARSMRPQTRPPPDAAEVFRKNLLRAPTPASLIPGLDLSKALGAIDDGDDASSSKKELTPQQVRARMENQVTRLELGLAAREEVLKAREVAVTGKAAAPKPKAELPTRRFVSLTPSAAAPDYVRAISPTANFANQEQKSTLEWSCLWCQEVNKCNDTKTSCGACGAETGPAAGWRQFRFTKPPKLDIMKEVRGRINNGVHDAGEAVVAGHFLMLFRKAFLLRAKTEDFALLGRLIDVLIQSDEKVLAAVVYTRIVPAKLRKVSKRLHALAAMFHPTDESRQTALRGLKEGIANDKKFFPAVFTESTCKVCFGAHSWNVCPIITRNFEDQESINITPTLEGRIKAHFKSICGLISKAAAVAQEELAAAAQLKKTANATAAAADSSKKITDAVFAAYKSFVASPHREEIAAQHHEEVNSLSLQLSNSNYFRRAAFVLCHVPYHLRTNNSYLQLVSYFGVAESDAMVMLAPRKVGNTVGTTHPNFVQVAMTCCMCLDDRHASFKCNRLEDWLDNSLKLGLPAARGKKLKTGANAKKTIDVTPTLLKAQVDGWCGSGPERLFSFHRFLIHSIDAIIAAARGNYQSSSSVGDDAAGNALQLASDVLRKDSPIAYAFNRCITQLFATGMDQLATKLLALTPPEILAKTTILRALKAANVADSALSQFENLSEAAVWRESSRWAPLILPNDTCFVCFSNYDPNRNTTISTSTAVTVKKHSFHTCPEVVHLGHVDKIVRIARSLLSLRLDSRGAKAAADYLNHCHLTYLMSTDMLRTNTKLTQVILDVAAKCFVIREPQRGLRLMRRVPIQLVPTPMYTSLWKASGMTEESVSHLESKLDNLFASYQLRPPTKMSSISSISAVPSASDELDPRAPAKDFKQTPEFLRSFSQIVAGSLCRQCCHHGHHVTQCAYFRAEAALGRDLTAIFRVATVSERFTAIQSKRYCARMINFVLLHRYHLPFHILGVQRMVSGLCASSAMQGEPGIALRVLLAIPAAHRMRHNFLHILHAFGLPKKECIMRMKHFVVTGDATSSSTTPNPGESDFRINPDHLLNHRPPIADVVMNLLDDVAGVKEALAAADGRILDIIAAGDNAPGSPKKPAAAAASSSKDVHRQIVPVQNGDIESIREAFMAIHLDVEKQANMRLGSRHEVFESGIEILEPSAATATAATPDGERIEKVHITVDPSVDASSSEEERLHQKGGGDLLNRTTTVVE